MDAAYGAHAERLLASQLAQTLGERLATPTWTASRVFAVANADDLLYPASRAILDAFGDQTRPTYCCACTGGCSAMPPRRDSTPPTTCYLTPTASAP